jgi:hypothetical protein
VEQDRLPVEQERLEIRRIGYMGSMFVCKRKGYTTSRTCCRLSRIVCMMTGQAEL